MTINRCTFVRTLIFDSLGVINKGRHDRKLHADSKPSFALSVDNKATGSVFINSLLHLTSLKAGVHLKAVLPPLNLGLMTTWSALAWISTVWWCSKNNFISSIPSLNLLKLHSNSCLPAP